MGNISTTQQFLTYRQTGQVKLKCVIRLDGLFPDQKSKEHFAGNWTNFIEDSCNGDIYRLQGNMLIYDSEHLIPTQYNGKPSLLLVLGNPASESVKRGMFFATDKNNRELKFWKHIIEKAELLPPISYKQSTANALNQRRKKQIWNLDFISPFRIGLSVFVTMPSAAGGIWSGVAGVKRLLKAHAFRTIEKEETKRIIKCARKFVQNNGAVVTFQKNAWENLRSENDPVYTIDRAKEGELIGRIKGHSDIRLYGVPPTRLVGPCRKILARVKDTIVESVVLSSPRKMDGTIVNSS